MSKEVTEINTIVDLRNHALNMLLKLERGEITTDEVGVITKVYENVISSVKTEMAYANMIGLKPEITFIEDGATYVGELAPKVLPWGFPPKQTKLDSPAQ